MKGDTLAHPGGGLYNLSLHAQADKPKEKRDINKGRGKHGVVPDPVDYCFVLHRVVHPFCSPLSSTAALERKRTFVFVIPRFFNWSVFM